MTSMTSKTSMTTMTTSTNHDARSRRTGSDRLTSFTSRAIALVPALMFLVASAADAGTLTVQGCTGHDLVKVKQGLQLPILIEQDLSPAAPFAPTSFEECAVAASGVPKACAAVSSTWIGLTPPGAFNSFRMEGTMNVGKSATADLAVSEQFREITLVVAGTTVSNTYEFRLIGTFTESLPQNNQLSYQLLNGNGTLIHQSVPGPFNDLIGLTDGTYTLRMTARAELPPGTNGSGALSFLFQLTPADTACGQPGLGTCIAPHTTPNCDDELCCTQICQTLDPTCCQVAWDQTCANLAQTNCLAPEPTLGPVTDPITGRRFVTYPSASQPFALAAILADGRTPATIRDGRQERWLRRSVFIPGLPNEETCRIGLSDAASEGTFRWFDGSVATYTNWRPGEPNNSGDEDFVEMSLNGGWNDVKPIAYQPTLAEYIHPACGHGGSPYSAHGPGCDDPVLCMEICTTYPPCCDVQWDSSCILLAQAAGVPQVEAGPFVNPSNGHRYWVLTPTRVVLAQRFAHQLGGTLAIPNDAAEEAWIASIIPSPVDEVLIGINDCLVEGTFRTEVGDWATYQHWGANEPDDFAGVEDAVALSFAYFGGAWNDVNGALAKRSVVEATCLGDLNDDAAVDGSDLSILLGGWGTAAGDLNGDSITDGADLSVLLGAWGAC